MAAGITLLENSDLPISEGNANRATIDLHFPNSPIKMADALATVLPRTGIRDTEQFPHIGIPRWLHRHLLFASLSPSLIVRD
jgi:hypothetical protein